MNIGDVAKASGVPPKTIRYYEEIGLIRPPRHFREVDLHKLAFVGRARALGFPIAECRLLLALYEDDSRSSAEVKQVAQHHLAAIDRKIADLSEMRSTLADLVQTCAGDERPDCPILSSLAQGEG
jgi:Cu(I)-responsive transcriptional regulator